MYYGIFGGATKWSKVLIANFNKQKCKLVFTCSKFLKTKKNITDIKKLPNIVNFIVIATNPCKNLKLLNLFKNIYIFCEKPILPNYKQYEKITKRNNNFIFCNYQHIYSEPIIFLKKKLLNKKNFKIIIKFGKNGKQRNILPSYEWLPHPLSILFYWGISLNNAKIFNENYKNKFKQNFLIQNKNITILSGNNFKIKNYSIQISIGSNIYYYNATKPLECFVNKNKIIFSNRPLESSIKNFLSFLQNPKIYYKEIALNSKITGKIMEFFKKHSI